MIRALRAFKSKTLGATVRASAQTYPEGTLVFRKHANRRLYSQVESRYISLGEVNDMVRKGMNFVVLDVHNRNITGQILLSLLLDQDQEAETEGLLPVSQLIEILKLYEDRKTYVAKGSNPIASPNMTTIDRGASEPETAL